MANIRQNIAIALGLKAMFLVTTVLGPHGSHCRAVTIDDQELVDLNEILHKRFEIGDVTDTGHRFL